MVPLTLTRRMTEKKVGKWVPVFQNYQTCFLVKIGGLFFSPRRRYGIQNVFIHFHNVALNQLRYEFTVSVNKPFQGSLDKKAGKFAGTHRFGTLKRPKTTSIGLGMPKPVEEARVSKFWPKPLALPAQMVTTSLMV